MTETLITLLTGKRPKLLERTLDSVKKNQPELLKATWLVLHNGGDRETSEVLLDSGIPLEIETSESFLDIGLATSLLFRLASSWKREYLLHLEDDWEASLGIFLPRAKELLEEAFQVRLRKASEKVLTRHMVTGRQLHWKPGFGAWLSTDAHYTLNPSLIRLGDLRFGFPASSEQHAQRKFHKAGKRKVAQILPGIFSHTGGSESLRKR